MTQVQMALMWAAIIFLAAFTALWIDLPGPSSAILITSLASAGAVSIGAKARRKKGCRS